MELKRVGSEHLKLETEKLSAQIGLLIKQARKSRGVTQEKLAEAADISEKYLSSVENGKESNISMGYILAIALALDISLLKLLPTSAHEN